MSRYVYELKKIEEYLTKNGFILIGSRYLQLNKEESDIDFIGCTHDVNHVNIFNGLIVDHVKHASEIFYHELPCPSYNHYLNGEMLLGLSSVKTYNNVVDINVLLLDKDEFDRTIQDNRLVNNWLEVQTSDFIDKLINIKNVKTFGIKSKGSLFFSHLHWLITAENFDWMTVNNKLTSMSYGERNYITPLYHLVITEVIKWKNP